MNSEDNILIFDLFSGVGFCNQLFFTLPLFIWQTSVIVTLFYAFVFLSPTVVV